MNLYLVTGIAYDTDGAHVDLPRQMTVEADDEYEAIDMVSEETGFLVESCDEVILL